MSAFEQSILGLIRFTILVIGLTYYITGSVIFSVVRTQIRRRLPGLTYFIYCPMCIGTWVGLFLALAGIQPLSGTLHAPWLDAMVLGAVANLFAPHGVPFDHPTHEHEHDETTES